ncbi:MAG: hypothetical protein PHW14_05705 [Candidatus Omnitrophica bacterium]|nr:hypothetical protein [Candidatus Omnitrophota bacterium]
MENRAGAWKISPILSAGTGKPAVKHVLAVICLVFLCFLLYSNTFGNGFVMDDLIVVENNPFIASWSNLKHFTDPSEYFMASGERTYRPVTTLSYFFDHALWRYYPGGYHFTNTVLHAVNGVLVYFILLYMLKRCKMTGLATSGERRTVDMVPLIVSLLFISHPAQTEGVNFIGGRHDILMTFFYLASLLSYLKASSDPLRSGIKYYLLSLALFGLSCFAKETGITLPAVLVLIDAFTAPQDLKQDFWKKRIVIYTLFASVALFYVYIRSVRMVMPGEFVDTGGERFPALAWMFMNYLRILLFPARLSAEYGAGPGYPTQIPATFAQPEAYLPAAIVLGLAGAVIFSRRRAPMYFSAVHGSLSLSCRRPT